MSLFIKILLKIYGLEHFNGLYKLNNNGKLIKHYKNEPDNQNSLIGNIIRSITETPNGILWINTDKGFVKFDQKKEKFKNFQNKKNTNSISYNRVVCSTYDKKDSLWIGTIVGGLNKFNIQTETFKQYSVKNGLPSNFIYSILIDNDKKLWMGTGKGISFFNVLSEKFRNFVPNDGIQDYEYCSNASLKSNNGMLYFGGINGFNIIDPKKISRRTFIPSVLMTSITVIGKDGKQIKQIPKDNLLNLYHGDYYISFNFAALDYLNPLKNKYAYQLDGLDKDWVYTDGKKSFATYTTLPAGTYIFKVKGTNSDGLWNKKITSVTIIVHPPFWETIWFRFLILVIIILSATKIYKVRLKKIETKIPDKSK